MNRISDIHSDSLAPMNPSERLDEVLGLPRFDWQQLNPIVPLEPRSACCCGEHRGLDPLRCLVWGGYALAVGLLIGGLVR